MNTRRQFLQFGALAATAATLLPRALRSQTSAPAATAGTAPQGLIDLHNHWISPGALEVLSTKTVGVRYVTNEKGEHNLVRPGAPAPSQGPRPGGLRGTQMFDPVEVRLKHLDQHGVQRQLISWPTTSNVDPDLTADEARLLWTAYNNDLSDLVQKHPDRFSGVAALSTLDIDWSATELERAHDKLGFIGGVLPVNGFDTLEGAKVFAPIFEVAQKHKGHIYLHTGYANAKVPGQPPRPSHQDSKQARSALDNIWNFTAATITLGFSGFLDGLSRRDRAGGAARRVGRHRPRRGGGPAVGRGQRGSRTSPPSSGASISTPGRAAGGPRPSPSRHGYSARSRSSLARTTARPPRSSP